MRDPPASDHDGLYLKEDKGYRITGRAFTLKTTPLHSVMVPTMLKMKTIMTARLIVTVTME